MAKRPTPRQIADAYARLGIAPGATMKDARRAYRKAAKDVHPDHHPDDPEAGEKFRLLMEAWGYVEDHIKRGGGLADLGGDVEPPPRAGPKVTIWETIAPAGAGKTSQWAAGMARKPASDGWRPVRDGEVFAPGRRFRMNQTTGVSEVYEGAEAESKGDVVRRDGFQWPPGHPRHMIYAAPTIELLNQTAEALRAAGVRTMAIHSQSPGKSLVHYKLARWFESIKPEHDAVLLCTHQAVLALPDRYVSVKKQKPGIAPPIVFDKAEWDLTMDEAPEILTFYAESWPLTQGIIANRVEIIPFGNYMYRLVPRDEGAITMLRMLSGDIPHDTNVSDGTREIAKALCDPYRLVIVSSEQWDDLTGGGNPYQMLYGGAVDVLVLVSPLALVPYRSVTVLGARLDTCMYHVLWRKLFNMEYRSHPLQERLTKTHRNGRYLTIHYMTEERATRDLLARQSVDGRTIFTALADRVATFFKPPMKHRQFVWSAPLDRGSIHGVKDSFFRDIVRPKSPSSRPGSRPFDPVLRLAGKAMGQNRYRKYHNAVLLSVVNFSPNQFVMLHGLGLSDKEIDRALAHNVAYQDGLRCSLRENSVRERRHVIVVDRATALDIGGEFPGCTMRELADAPQRAGRKRPGPKKGTAPLSSAERQRRHRGRMRAERQRAKEQASGT